MDNQETKPFTALVGAIIAVGLIIGLIGLVFHYSRSPTACVDSVTLVSVMPGNPSSASCRAGMTMTTKTRVQGVEVTCMCPRAK